MRDKIGQICRRTDREVCSGASWRRQQQRRIISARTHRLISETSLSAHCTIVMHPFCLRLCHSTTAGGCSRSPIFNRLLVKVLTAIAHACVCDRRAVIVRHLFLFSLDSWRENERAKRHCIANSGASAAGRCAHRCESDHRFQLKLRMECAPR